MKKLLLVNVLFLFCIISEAQIIQNPSLTTSQAPGSFLFPESWSKSGVAQGLMDAGGNPNSGGGPPFTRPILNMFTSADSNDLFWYFWSNTLGQFGGISQVLQNLESNTEYCFSFEAAVNRRFTSSTTIDFELYFDGVLSDSETFYYPSETSSRRVELCFTTGTGITTGTMDLRTNNLQGLTTFVLIQAGSGEFSCPSPIDLAITLDNNPEQTTWEITDANGAVVVSGGPYNLADNGATIVEPVCLPDGCYDLTLFDSANDGMCASVNSSTVSIGSFVFSDIYNLFNGLPRLSNNNQGASSGKTPLCGNYVLSYPPDGTSLASGNGQFGSSETNSFCLPTVALANRDSGMYPPNSTNFDTPQIRLLPNVAKDNMMLYYSLTTENDVYIRIVDISGKVMQQHIHNADNTPELQLNVSDLSEGFYFVQLISGDVTMVQKFIKQ